MVRVKLRRWVPKSSQIAQEIAFKIPNRRNRGNVKWKDRAKPDLDREKKSDHPSKDEVRQSPKVHAYGAEEGGGTPYKPPAQEVLS